MFWRKKGSKGDSQDVDNEDIEPKKPGRRIFGFECTVDVHVNAKAIAKRLNVELWTVAEHAMQLGLNDISATLKDPAETELLRDHLHDAHTLTHLANSLSQYDVEAAEYIRDGQLRKYRNELALRQLIELCVKYRLDPLLIKQIVMRELQRKS